MSKKLDLFSDSESSDSEDRNINVKTSKKKDDIDSRFHKKELEGVSGHMLLQMKKGYKGDDRFQLDDRFAGDINFAHQKLSNNVLGAMSKLETNQMLEKKKKDTEAGFDRRVKELSKTEKKKADDEINIENEKDTAFNILSQIVPAAEVFFKPSGAGDKRKKNFNIKRFDPKKLNQ